jgi:peptide/nickel transport system substrate-binding protein
MSQKNEVLADPKVREALKYLADYEGMANSFLKGQYTVHQSFLPLTYLGALEEKPYSLDIDKGRALLEEAGYGDGFEIEIIVRTAQERIAIAQSLQNTFGQAGIEVSIQQGTGKQILGQYRSRDFDIYVGAWGPDYPDPHTNADTFAHNPDNSDEAQLTGKLAWRVAWEIPDFTRRVEEAVVESDVDTRRQMYLDIQRDWQQVAPFAPMFQKIEQVARQDNVEGFVTGAAITAAFYWTVTK